MGTNLSTLNSDLCLHLYRHRIFHHMRCRYENYRCHGHIRADIKYHNDLVSLVFHLLGYGILTQTNHLSSSFYSRCGPWLDMCDKDNHTLVLVQVYLKAAGRFDIAN